MGQLQWIQHCTCVALTELRVHHVASDAETWQLQYYVFITLHLMLKRGYYITACFARPLMLKRGECSVACSLGCF
jgi:hypothetical protein